MPITFNCACGKTLKAQDEAAGRKTKCPQCSTVLTIPGTPIRTPVTTRTTGTAATAATINPDALVVEGLVWTTTDATEESAGSSPPVTASGEAVRPPDPPKPTDGTLQYKVLSQKDHSASGRINFGTFEAALNDHARLGWKVKSSLVVNVPGHAGNHDELVVILER